MQLSGPGSPPPATVLRDIEPHDIHAPVGASDLRLTVVLALVGGTSVGLLVARSGGVDWIQVLTLVGVYALLALQLLEAPRQRRR